MFPNVIIAADYRQAEYVANWLSRYPSGPRYDGYGSCPPVPRLSIETTAWCSADAALPHLYELRPKRIIIVDYVNWHLPEPGDLSRLAQTIQIQKIKGAEVVWW